MKSKAVYMMLVLCLCSGHVSAQQASEALSEYRRAGDRFSVLVADAESRVDASLDEKAETLRNPEFEALVDVLSDDRRTLANAGHLGAGLDVSIEICDTSNKAVMALVLFDIESIAPLQDTSSAVTELNALMARNTLQFEAELTRMQPFLLRCLAGQMAAMGRFLASLPPEEFTDIRRNGVRKVRMGTIRSYLGIMLIASDPAFSEPYRKALLSTLADKAEEFATVVPLQEREVIAAEAAARLTTMEDPGFRDNLTKIERVFRGTDCSGLCVIE